MDAIGVARLRGAEGGRAARRIDENLRYAAAADALRGPRTRVVSLRTCAGPLPGLYPEGDDDIAFLEARLKT